MNGAVLFPTILVGLGLAVIVAGWLMKVRQRTQSLSDILDLPYGERDVSVSAITETRSPLVESTVGLAARMVTQFDSKGTMKAALERARLPVKPGEYVVLAGCASLALAAVLYALTTTWLFGLIGLVIGPLGASSLVNMRITRRRRAFEAQLPDSLSLIASSLAAGHTFLRSIQMMCEESEPPLAEEFARVVSETRLGDPLVDSLGRMAQRLQIRDLDWVVQAIRIQQTVGGRLADLLHTLADFIRAREEVRREVKTLTAEGRLSAWILTGLAPFMLLMIQVLNPGYIDPMYSGVGLLVLIGTGLMVAMGSFIIFRMTKIEV